MSFTLWTESLQPKLLVQCSQNGPFIAHLLSPCDVLDTVSLPSSHLADSQDLPAACRRVPSRWMESHSGPPHLLSYLCAHHPSSSELFLNSDLASPASFPLNPAPFLLHNHWPFRWRIGPLDANPWISMVGLCWEHTAWMDRTPSSKKRLWGQEWNWTALEMFSEVPLAWDDRDHTAGSYCWRPVGARKQ